MAIDESRTVQVIDDRIPVNVRRLIDLAQATTAIETLDQRKRAGELHAQLGAERRDTQRQQKEDVQLQSAIKAVERLREPYTLAVKTLEEWEAFVAKRMGIYDATQLRIARENQAKVNVKTESKNMAIIAKAEETGVRPILQATPIVAASPKTVKTEEGLSSSRKQIYVFNIPGVGPDEDLTKLLGSDPRFAKIDDSLFLLNVAEIKQQVKRPSLHASLRAQGITIEEDFSYDSRG